MLFSGGEGVTYSGPSYGTYNAFEVLVKLQQVPTSIHRFLPHKRSLYALPA